MNKFIILNIFLSIGNIIFIMGMKLLFSNRIEITYHLNANIILACILVFISSLIAFSKIISLIFNEKLIKSIAKTTIGLLLSLLSLNIFSLLKFLYKIVTFNDLLFESKIITVRYKYTREELYKFINDYYNELIGENIRLPLKIKAKILGKSETIEEVKVNVVEYIENEKNSIYTKLYEFSVKTLDLMINHPYIAGFCIITISTLVIIPIIKVINDKLNLFSVIRDVQELNRDILEQSRELEVTKTMMRKLVEQLIEIHKTNSVLYPIIHEFLVLTARQFGETDINKLIEYKKIARAMSNKLFELMGAERTQQVISRTRSEFEPFTGEGNRLGSRDEE